MNLVLCIACLFIPSNDPRFLPQPIPAFPELSQIDLREQCAEPLACTWPMPLPSLAPSYRLWLLSRDTGIVLVKNPFLSDSILLVKLDSSDEQHVRVLKPGRPLFLSKFTM